MRGFAKYLELSHDKKRQQQMKHIKAARGTHKMLFSSFRSQDGPRRPECFWIYGPLPHAAACSPRADVGAIKTNRPLSFHHPLSDNARGEERSGVLSSVCTHNGSEQIFLLQKQRKIYCNSKPSSQVQNKTWLKNFSLIV